MPLKFISTQRRINNLKIRTFRRYILFRCHMPSGLAGAVRSRHVHQLKQTTHVSCGSLTLFNITDITNSLAEPHFKATRRVIGELLKVNTANWRAFPLKYKVFNKYNTSRIKNGLWTAVSGSTRLITIFFYWIKERNKKKTIQVKPRSEKVFLLNSGRRKYSSPAVDTIRFPSDFGIWWQSSCSKSQVYHYGEYSFFLSPLSYQSYSFLP